MKRHELPKDLPLDPAVRSAIELVIVAIEDRLESIDARLGDMAKAFIENCESNSQLIEELRADRRWREAAALPPMRPKLDTFSALSELAEAATTRGSAMPSERVKALFDRFLGQKRLEKYDEETKDRRKLKYAIAGSVIAGAIMLLVAGFFSGHLEGRASAPVSAPAPTGGR